MVFDYYRQLPRSERRIYNQSDRITTVTLPRELMVREHVEQIRDALAAENRTTVQRASAGLCDQLCAHLAAPPVRVKVLARRPNDDWGELQGLYEGRDGQRQALISLWMHTSVKGSVVAVRTFLRTLFHELCHHLDYEYFKLEESYHTEGFYKREASLFNQLTEGVALPGGRRRKARAA